MLLKKKNTWRDILPPDSLFPTEPDLMNLNSDRPIFKLWNKYLYLNRTGNHFFPFPPAFFWAFWAALSWAFCWAAWPLFWAFFSVAFLAAAALFLYLISLIASSAKAFFSSGRAFLNFLISSRVTPSIALYFLKTLFFLFFP